MNLSQSTWLPHIVAILVVVIWGSTFVFTKLLLINGLTAAHIFTLRFIIAYVLLLAFSLSRYDHRCLYRCCYPTLSDISFASASLRAIIVVMSWKFTSSMMLRFLIPSSF